MTIYGTLEKELYIVNHAQADYKSKLDRIIPKLLKNASNQMKEKKIAVRLTNYFDVKGNYFDSSQKRDGSTVFYLFPEGIKKIKTIYDDEALPQTKEVLISRNHFLNWVKTRFDRTEDVYNHLIKYQNLNPLEDNFPIDDII